MTGPASHRSQAGGELPTTDELCAAAMKCFASNGIEAGSLREVAQTAGVSVGFVQNRFGSKAALVEAVNERLIAIFVEASPSPTPGPDPVAELSQRSLRLIAEHPDAIDYLGQLLLTDHPAGRAIFDQLLAISTAHCREKPSSQREDGDPTWDALNPLLHILAMLIFRSHIERQLTQDLGSPDQRRRWESALDHLIDGSARGQ